jgi:starch synthase
MRRLNFILLVDGESHYRDSLEKLAKRYDNFTLIYGYNESLSHRIYAGGDFLVMPSLFEPCGLNQMIAMRYATIPIVHAVGGLFDSVHESKGLCGEGFVFFKPKKKELIDAIIRALNIKKDAKESMMRFDMRCDFSFEKQIEKYLKLYEYKKYER